MRQPTRRDPVELFVDLKECVAYQLRQPAFHCKRKQQEETGEIDSIGPPTTIRDYRKARILKGHLMGNRGWVGAL